MASHWLYEPDAVLQFRADQGDVAAIRELRIRAIHSIGRAYNRALRARPLPDPLTRTERFTGSYADSFAA